MILTGEKIRDELDWGGIVITPFNKDNLGPNSYDVTLNNKLLIYKDEILDLKKPPTSEELFIPDSGLLLKPNQIYIGCINEYTESSKYLMMMHGKSSLGRLGLVPHICAGLGDVAFKGQWTVELTCIHPIIIYPNVQIAQLTFHVLSGSKTMEYAGKYQDSRGPIASQFYKNFK